MFTVTTIFSNNGEFILMWIDPPKIKEKETIELALDTSTAMIEQMSDAQVIALLKQLKVTHYKIID
jgi:hypothetical protein